MSVIAAVGLGANLDNPARQLEAALTELDRLPATRLLARSQLYASAPVGYLDQPDFVNAAALLDTALAPRALLAALLALEQSHGRERSFPNAPRTLDLDLLLYGQARFDEPGLNLPHPRLAQRAFALVPLLEIAPHVRIPGIGLAASLLNGCAGQAVRPLAALAA